MPPIYEATRSFSVVHKKQRINVHKGETTVEGHWLLDAYADAFRPLRVTHDLPAAVKKPAPAPAAKVAAVKP